VTTPNGDIACDNVTITHKLNDIPVATISAIPRTEQEVILAQDIDANLFKKFTVTTEINGTKSVIFEGEFAGAQSIDSPNSVQLGISLYGGLYKLAQMSALTLGLHILGEHSMYRFSTQSAAFLKLVLSNSTQQSSQSTIVEIFGDILQSVFTAVINATPSSPGVRGSAKTIYGNISSALQSLYQFHSKSNQDLLTKELDKIKVAQGLSIDAYAAYSSEKVKTAIFTVCSSPGASFWEILMKLCEMYQMNLGTHGDQIYAMPFSPVGSPGINITATDLKSVRIDPLPLQFPTRCYFSTSGYVGSSIHGMTSNGSFPTADKADKPTELEKKLGSIRVIFYNLPDFALHRKQIASPTSQQIKNTKNPNNRKTYSTPYTKGGTPSGNTPPAQNQTPAVQLKAQQKIDDLNKIRIADDAFAKIYLLKEMFKHRTASIEMRYYPDLPVGCVVKFIDPFFRKGYQGYVTSVSHNLSSTGSIGTTLSLQYVIGDKEREYLGFDADGYFDNLLYPSYQSSELLALLGIT